MAYPSVTHSFSNSTTADATQVNTNFTDLINGASDGTKDYSINALTCAGAATLNGNVTLGNATSDDVTITGSIAASIPVKTTFSYDLGSSTIGWKSIYFGSNDSAAKTVRVIAGAVGTSFTLTLPTSIGTIGQFPVTDGSSALSFRYPDKTTAKTTTYTATGDESVILCDATSAAFTVTLPAAASYTGKSYKIKKTDSSTNAVTIDGNSSETIDAATTTTLNTQYESIEIVCDGSNWHVVDRTIPSAWTSFTMTITGSTSNPTKGTTSFDAAYWRRVGRDMEIRFDYKQTSGGAAGSGTYLFAIPSGYTIDTSVLGTTSADNGVPILGVCNVSVTGVITHGFMALYNSTNLYGIVSSDTTAPVEIGSAHSPLSTNSIRMTFIAKVPISGWKG